ncbi:MAG: hypothetical protein JWR16_2919 [Nevskia sp.]|nr:hypothetical protein [Nevskia sp.]
MSGFLRDARHRTWLLLVIATGATFWLRVDSDIGLAAAAGTIAIAYIKGRLIVLDFMELRHAPRIWKGIFETWLFVVSAIILAVYRFGLPAIGSA